MTSSTGSRTDSAFEFSDKDKDDIRERALRFEQIVAGALPTTDELLTGLPLCRDSLQSDAMAYIDSWRCARAKDDDVDAGLIAAAEIARATADKVTLQALRDRADAAMDAVYKYDDERLIERIDVWLMYLGDRDAIQRVQSRALARDGARFEISTAYRLVFGIGLSRRRTRDDYRFGDADDVIAFGMGRLTKLMPMIEALRSTVGYTDDGNPQIGLQRLAARMKSASQEDALTELSELLSEDKYDEERGVGHGEGLVVVPRLPTNGTSWRKEINRSWNGMAGVELPLVTRGEISAHRQSLVSQWPHAADLIDVVLGDLSAADSVRFRPTLFVGSPGSGKSSLARAICDVVGLPCELQSFAGLHDAALMGTSAQWGSAREAAPLQLIKRSGVANPAVIWDEIEKASDDRRNGAPAEALLAMLEVDQARRYRDLCLEIECDLSMVSHFATANELDGIPAPVRDRMRVLQMPDPGWQHLPVLTRQIIHRIARERGVDSRWFGGLAEDEMDLVRAAWPGGSIRKLTTVVRTILSGRERIMGSC